MARLHLIATLSVLAMHAGCAPSAAPEAPRTPPQSGEGSDPPTPASADGSWISVDRPPVKFQPPAGWKKNLSNGWARFTPSDDQAIIAFTTFGAESEGLTKLNAVSNVLSLRNIAWNDEGKIQAGKDRIPGKFRAATCDYKGPKAHYWYAFMNAGAGQDQLLFVYVASAAGRQHDQEMLATMKSLERR